MDSRLLARPIPPTMNPNWWPLTQKFILKSIKEKRNQSIFFHVSPVLLPLNGEQVLEHSSCQGPVEFSKDSTNAFARRWIEYPAGKIYFVFLAKERAARWMIDRPIILHRNSEESGFLPAAVNNLWGERRCSSKVQMNRLAEQRPAWYVWNKLSEHFLWQWKLWTLANLGLKI